MCWGRVIIFNSELGTEFSEFNVVELFSVVRYQRSWDTKPAYDGSPYEITYLLFCDCGQGLDLNPFGEVIYYDDDEFTLALSEGQRSQYIQTPLWKGQGLVIDIKDSDGRREILVCSWQILHFLTRSVTPLSIVGQ